MTASRHIYWRGSLLAGALVLLAVLWTSSRSGQLLRGFLNIKPLHTHGLAVDSEGTPLAGVKIQISWSTAWFLIGLPYDHNRMSWVTSDKNGEWTFSLEKPDRVFIKDAMKEGYAFEKFKGTHENLVDIREKTKRDDVEATVIMRKRNEEVLLLRSPASQVGCELWAWTTNGMSILLDMDILSTLLGGKKESGTYRDLHVQAEFNPDSQCWTLSFSTPNEGDGLLDKNELLFEAPADGYVKEVVYKVIVKEQSAKEENYLYLKSRPQGLYTRLTYRYDSWNFDSTGPNFRVYLGTVTNPYGERSFEYPRVLEEKYSFAEDEMVLEAKQSIQAGKLPKKPENLEAHLEEREKAIRKAKNIPMR